MAESLIKTDKQLRFLYLVCIGQLLVILRLHNPTWTLISAILGILFSGSARRYYRAYQSEQILKEIKQNEYRTKD